MLSEMNLFKMLVSFAAQQPSIFDNIMKKDKHT